MTVPRWSAARSAHPWYDAVRWRCFRCDRMTRRRHVDLVAPSMSGMEAGGWWDRDTRGRWVLREPDTYCSVACRHATSVERAGAKMRHG